MYSSVSGFSDPLLFVRFGIECSCKLHFHCLGVFHYVMYHNVFINLLMFIWVACTLWLLQIMLVECSCVCLLINLCTHFYYVNIEKWKG